VIYLSSILIFVVGAFFNISVMYKKPVGQGGVRVYEAHEVK
jgi:hypothetical protein